MFLLYSTWKVLVSQSCSTLCYPMEYSPPEFLCPWNSPGKNSGVDCHFLLQGIFPTLGSNSGLLHCRRVLYHLTHLESPHLTWPIFKSVLGHFILFCDGSVGKESTCNAGSTGDAGSIPGLGKIPWRKSWHPTSAFLPRESHGQRRPGYRQGYRWVTVQRVTKSQTWLCHTHTHTRSTVIPMRITYYHYSITCELSLCNSKPKLAFQNVLTILTSLFS